MAYGIGPDQKLGKQNRKRLDNTTDPFSSHSIPSYSCDRLNESTDSNTIIVLPPHFDTSTQNQLNNTAYASAGENNVSSSVLYQSTNHHCNTDSKNNDDS